MQTRVYNLPLYYTDTIWETMQMNFSTGSQPQRNQSQRENENLKKRDCFFVL